MFLLLYGCTPGVSLPGVGGATVVLGEIQVSPDVPAETVPDAPVDTAVVDTGDTGDSGDTGDTEDSGTDPDDEVMDAAWFNALAMQEVRLEITAAAINALRRDPTTYVEAGVTLIAGDGTVKPVHYDTIGVRLKGSSSYRPWTGNNKVALKFKLNEFVQGQKYGNLERITLNNETGDPAMAREVINYHFWSVAGQMASRASYARLYVNDEYYGLYTNVEAVDDHFLEHRYVDATGDLWEGNNSADFNRRSLQYFELVHGKGDTAALQAVSTTLQSADDVLADVGAVVDMNQFLDFWAYRIVGGDQDGYPYHINDYYVYDDPTTGLFQFMPWGVDESWDTSLYWSSVSGTMATTCMQDSACVDALRQHVEGALEQYRAADLSTFADQMFTLSAAAMTEDPRMEWSVASVEEARAELASRIRTWPATLEAQMGL